MTPPRGELVVHRVPNPGLGEQDPMTIVLDGERIGLLKPGDSLTVPVEPGGHRLRAGNTLLRTHVEFEVAPRERVRFAVRDQRNAATIFFALLGAGMWSIRLERKAP